MTEKLIALDLEDDVGFCAKLFLQQQKCSHQNILIFSFEYSTSPQFRIYKIAPCDSLAV